MAIEDFTGAVAVVTGGASGIGLATARALFAQGAHVVLADISADGLRQAAERVREARPARRRSVATVTTDVTDDAQVRELMRQAQALTGRIDLVVACAGIGRGGRIEDLSSSDDAPDDGRQLHGRLQLRPGGGADHARAGRRPLRADQLGGGQAGRPDTLRLLRQQMGRARLLYRHARRAVSGRVSASRRSIPPGWIPPCSSRRRSRTRACRSR